MINRSVKNAAAPRRTPQARLAMRRAAARIVLCTSICVSSFTYAKQAIPPRPQKIDFPALDWEIPLGSPYRTTLDNGLRLYIAEDHSLPLIEITGYVRSGAILDPAGKEGLGTLATRLLRTGGTKRFSGEALDKLIDRLAIQVSFSLNETDLEFRASFLSEYADTAFLLLEQMLFHPVYDSARIEKERQIMIQTIKHRFDNPEPTLSASYEKAMYPAQPNSRLATQASVAAISREDLFAFHRKTMKTGNIILAAAGDFEADSVQARFERMFPAADSAAAEVSYPEISIDPQSRLTLVHKPISQAYVRLGLPLFARPHPDYYPMSLCNLILGGGGFTSRLATRVRSDEGLTYSIYSRAGSNYVYPATLYINFFTRHETVNKAIGIILEEVKKLTDEGVTKEELENAKKVMIEGLPSSFRSPADIVQTYAWNEFYGRSEDHYRVYPGKLRALSRKDIRDAARAHLQPDAFTYVVVGDTTKLLGAQKAAGFSLESIEDMRVLRPEQLPAESAPQKD
jgi:zinc protease